MQLYLPSFCRRFAVSIMSRPTNQDQEERFFTRKWRWLKAFPERMKAKACEVSANTKKIAQDDPRRVIHSAKVGLALTLVSLFYYYQPLYDTFGFSAMWAVMTVVVVFEFSVGATLGKCLNSGLATLAAGAFGVGARYLASLSGHIGEPILLGFFVFLQAATSTFTRFFPKIQARYDYGLLIFILTFSLISVSGFRDDEIIELAYKRLSTIIIGGLACVIITIFVCPVWAGEDLHNLIAVNVERLANFLEVAKSNKFIGFGDKYFKTSIIFVPFSTLGAFILTESNKYIAFGDEYFKTTADGESSDGKSCLGEYKNALSSKNTEESLANFARWEPRHGQFQFRHPWTQYLKIGNLTRECAYIIDALSGYINSDVQVSLEIRSKIQDACTKMSFECGKALQEVASAIRTMSKPSSADRHVSNSKTAAKNLESLLRSGLLENPELYAVLPAATVHVVSRLFDVVECTEKIVDSVHELASMAHFKTVDRTVSPEKEEVSHDIEPVPKIDSPHVVVTVNESTRATSTTEEQTK